MTHEVFISYSTANVQTANAICHVLEENNLRCWIAPRNITAGKNYAEEIVKGIESAKIIVLVFSKDAQESSFVNNEIELTFSNNKPIISFKIDETMPEKNMEYFLKNKHWLEAHPNPEAQFETLVRDALKLCDEKPTSPIIIRDMKEFKSKNNLGFFKDKISLILLCTPLYSLSFLYMGFKANKRLWRIMGVLYLLPLLICIFFLIELVYPFYAFFVIYDYFFKLFILFWVISIIHAIVIRKEFLAREIVTGMMSVDDKMFDELLDEYSRI